MRRPRLALTMSIGALALACGTAQKHTISSPNGRVSLIFDVREGTPHYAVEYDGKPVIESSGLGIRLKEGKPLKRSLGRHWVDRFSNPEHSQPILKVVVVLCPTAQPTGQLP